MTGAGTVQTGSASDFETLYAGYRWDNASPQLYYVRNRFLLPMIGTWNKRDPIGYGDGQDVYAYVHNRPESSKDPFGLDTIVGVTPPTRTNPRRCVIWRKDYGQQRCYKRCKGDDRLLPTTCPDHPDDDPDGPSYQTGIDGLARGSRMLRELCDNCAAASGCSVAECKEEVNDIIFRLIAAWQNNGSSWNLMAEC